MGSNDARGGHRPSGPPVLVDHDESWAARAENHLAAIRPALAPLGWRPAVGSRPGSPGVVRDLPTPGDDEAGWVWAKRLFFVDGRHGDEAILHVRLTASPFGRRTVAFRDRLRADPDLREGYAALKRRLAAVHAGDEDYDDYTRGKSAFVHAAASG